jgi:uncharacterized protein YaiL (DUF2058 family)
MSLREQLLKAGLVSKEQAKQAESGARKQGHQIKKKQAAPTVEAARQAEERRQREAEKQRKASLAQARQLIDSNRLNEADAESRYNFTDGRYIRSVRVTSQQQKLLAMGRIGIARNDANPYDFPLIPRETALKLTELCPDKLLLLHPENDGNEAEEDWDSWQ